MKQPIRLERDVPIGKVIMFLLKYFVNINLMELPIPPPKKTKTKDLKSKLLRIN